MIGLFQELKKEKSAKEYLRSLLLKEYPEETVNRMMQRASRYSTEEIERVANAIDRFGAAELFLSVQF